MASTEGAKGEEEGEDDDDGGGEEEEEEEEEEEDKNDNDKDGIAIIDILRLFISIDLRETGTGICLLILQFG
jgi:TATA-binding protein-associated factor Taf7